MLRIVAEGDWGGTLLSDVEAVAASVASCFATLQDHGDVAISLLPTPSEDDPPITLSSLDPTGAFVVRLNVRGNLWARLAYQFAHELCHVLADIRTWPGGNARFAWLEEAICETASLYALRSMARRWAIAPPYPQWQPYADELERYAAEHMAEPAHNLPPALGFSSWLRANEAALEADLGRRADQAIIAKRLLPIFEANEHSWQAVRSLHAQQVLEPESLGTLVEHWAEVAPLVCRSTIEAIGDALRTD